ncbi:VOC family protein [Bradyrhizobium sp. WSM3983]|uniref:VOC family protein n=1 Tax=Bradyrhizobium sp. WSM3983 TaxID=1038867 RepID=UPI000487B123|nr:VOC family protein [Bradyrhizobium sp. WSM3983]
MTGIRGLSAARRRPGVLGVHSLDHFSMSVPDLEKAKNFYDAFGLDVRRNGCHLTLHTNDHPHCWGVLSEGHRKKLLYVSFGAFEDDLPRFREHLGAMNIERLPAPPGFESNGLWFRNLDGLPIEIRVAEKVSPDFKSRFTAPSAGPAVRGTISRSKAPTTRPRRLAHVATYTSDVPRAVEFYTRVLGLRLSDSSEGNVAFMHGAHGSDHHMIALARSDGPGLHHCSWDVGGIQDVGLGAMQMANKGYDQGWGMGRHVLGSNYFHYIRDPWGSYSEYSADMDYIPADVDWAASDHHGNDSFYLWGPSPPADFVRNFETDNQA